MTADAGAVATRLIARTRDAFDHGNVGAVQTWTRMLGEYLHHIEPRVSDMPPEVGVDHVVREVRSLLEAIEDRTADLR